VNQDFIQHVQLSGRALGIAIVVALILGTLVARIRFLYAPVLAILGVAYTIPSLAMLAFLIPVAGIGSTPTIIALVIYAQFILVRNVAVGLREVDPTIIDVARGLGMNWLQILLRVEYPLALPVMLAGLRVATVAVIAIATIGAFIDAGGLGTLLFDGVSSGTGNTSELIVGGAGATLLAVAADIFLRIVDRFLPATRGRAVSQ